MTKTSEGQTWKNGPRVWLFVFQENAQHKTLTVGARWSTLRMSTNPLPQALQCLLNGHQNKVPGSRKWAPHMSFLPPMTNQATTLRGCQFSSSSNQLWASSTETWQEDPPTWWRQMKFTELFSGGEGSNLSPLKETLILGLAWLSSFVLPT